MTRWLDRKDPNNRLLILILLVLILGSGAFLYGRYRSCAERGPSWMLVRNGLGWPVCVKLERAP